MRIGAVAALVVLGGAGFAWWQFRPEAREARLARMDAVQLAEEVALNPDDAGLLLRLGGKQEATQTQAALNAYRQAANLEPKRARALLAAADLLIRLGQTPEAQTALNEAAAREPNAPGIPLVGGRFALRQNQLEKAGELLQKAVQQAPESAEAWAALAEYQNRTRKFTEAETSARKAIGRDPRSVAGSLALHRALSEMGRDSEAVAAARQAAAIAPQNPEAQLALGQGLLRMARAEVDYAAAADALDHALQSAADSPLHAQIAASAAYSLGLLHVRQNRYAEAIAAFRRALQIRPDDEQALFNLSRALLLDGQAQEAAAVEKRFQKASAYNREAARLMLRSARRPDDVNLVIQIGDLHAANGRLPEAAAAYRRALQIRPDARRAQEKLQRIEQALSAPSMP